MVKQKKEELKNIYKVSRQSINSIEKKINNRLRHALNFNQEPVKQWIVNNKNKLSDKFCNLYKYFEESSFYSFLEICFDLNKNSLCDTIQLKINRDALTPFFCKNQSPVKKDILIDELISVYECDIDLAQIILNKLVYLGSI